MSFYIVFILLVAILSSGNFLFILIFKCLFNLISNYTIYYIEALAKVAPEAVNIPQSPNSIMLELDSPFLKLLIAILKIFLIGNQSI